MSMIRSGFSRSGSTPDRRLLWPGIDDNQSLGPGEVNRSGICHIKQISHGVNEKIPEIFFLGPGGK